MAVAEGVAVGWWGVAVGRQWRGNWNFIKSFGNLRGERVLDKLAWVLEIVGTLISLKQISCYCSIAYILSFYRVCK